VDTLDSYLRGEFIHDQSDVDRLTELSTRILRMYVAEGVIDRTTLWPYSLVDSTPVVRQENLSSSTASMILFALAVASGRITSSSLVPAAPLASTVTIESSPQLWQGLDDAVKLGIQLLVDQVATSREPEPLTSRTFGARDPFTLTWFLELLHAFDTAADAPAEWTGVRKTVEEIARKRVDDVLANPDRPALTYGERPANTPSTRRRPVDSRPGSPAEGFIEHAFPILRIVQLDRLLGERQIDSRTDLQRVRRWLTDRVHLHLSLSALRGGAFDAAELAFSLEGSLLLDPSPDLATVDRAFEVLSEAQESSVYWRPLRPFKVTPTGLVLLPQSIEIANSLLRICAQLDQSSGPSRFSAQLPLFRRYDEWLQSRVFQGRAKGPSGEIPFVGWESEHTYGLNQIHLWQTSQALLFVHSYVGMLRRHIAQTSGRAAKLRLRAVRGDNRGQDWAAFLRSEPLPELGDASPYAAYARIDRRFVRSRMGSSPAGKSDQDAPPGRGHLPASMILYGPPGTGKSTIARNVAAAIGYRTVTITPSDFIAGGREGMEARAKSIFQTLEQQTHLVVLFDELDQLLLDRDSDWYERQDDVFKLLTPGMLTKLNDLVGFRGNIYVIATNYFDRIDRAIARPGRIDERLLVLPPSRAGRLTSLRSESLNTTLPREARLDAASGSQLDQIATATPLYTYRELLDLAAKGAEASPASSAGVAEWMLGNLRDYPPIISLAAYEDRCAKGSGQERALEEFALVAYLRLEVGGALDEAWMNSAIVDALGRDLIRDAAVRLDLENWTRRNAGLSRASR
jgi:hypothetical protein